MPPDPSQLLPLIPKVDRLLAEVEAAMPGCPRPVLLDAVRETLEDVRRRIASGDLIVLPESAAMTAMVRARAEAFILPGIRRCVNGTGVVLHTSLGRAPLAAAAQEALAGAVGNYAMLALDAESGKRGDRLSSVEPLLRRLTGCQAALVVNNNAAATLLILNALAEGKEVVISRGELVEIGGSYRIPDVLQRSGAILREVGTTNRTHPQDYRNAIGPGTGMLLKVHQSNYRIVGFTSEVPIAEITAIAHAQDLPAIHDIGSGALVDLSAYGLPKEPVVQESLAAGADVVCFSGDKLLGGPQCGIVLGRHDLIARMKKNPLMRALRCDKMTLAALEATLRLFVDEEGLPRSHPVLRMLTQSEETLQARSSRLAERLQPVLAGHATVSVEHDSSEVGSGSMAGTELPTSVVAVAPTTMPCEEMSRRLRMLRIPIIGRINEQRYILDVRTIREDETELVVDGFREVFPRESGEEPRERLR
jgi:L-seryl-tRNA(Ser) seleniumtransferase